MYPHYLGNYWLFHSLRDLLSEHKSNIRKFFIERNEPDAGSKGD